MLYATAVFCIQRDTGAAFRSGRAPTPQKDDNNFRSLSFTDNVPFGDTLRAKGYSYFVVLLYTLLSTNASVYAYFFAPCYKISVWA